MWIEAEVLGFPDLLEGLSWLRGALMAAAVVMAERDGSYDTSRQGGDHVLERRRARPRV